MGLWKWIFGKKKDYVTKGIEMCDEMTNDCNSKNNYIEEFPCTLLSKYDLIKVNSPVWLGIDGETKRASWNKVMTNDDFIKNDHFFSSDDLNLIDICLKRANELNWKYIYMIMKFPSNNLDEGVGIRGSK